MRKLIEYNEVSKKAAKELQPFLDGALKEVQGKLADVESQTSLLAQKDALSEMLKEYKPATEGADAILAGYIGRFVPCHLRVNGGYVMGAFTDVCRSNELRGEAAKSAASALLAAQRGLVSPGLIDWPKQWCDYLSANQILVWVEILMPEKAEAYKKKIAELAEQKEPLKKYTAQLNSINLIDLILQEA